MQTMSLHSGKIFLLILCSLCVFTISQDLSNVLAAENNFESDYTFIITVDMRQYAMKIYHSPEHFWGVLQAVDRVGKGEFMISRDLKRSDNFIMNLKPAALVATKLLTHSGRILNTARVHFSNCMLAASR